MWLSPWYIVHNVLCFKAKDIAHLYQIAWPKWTYRNHLHSHNLNRIHINSKQVRVCINMTWLVEKKENQHAHCSDWNATSTWIQKSITTNQMQSHYFFKHLMVLSYYNHKACAPNIRGHYNFVHYIGQVQALCSTKPEQQVGCLQATPWNPPHPSKQIHVSLLWYTRLALKNSRPCSTPMPQVAHVQAICLQTLVDTTSSGGWFLGLGQG